MRLSRSRPSGEPPPAPVASPERLRQWVEELSFPRDPESQPEANRRAAEFIAMEFASQGYAVTFDGPHRNVVALPKQSIDRVTWVGAHYDSVPETPGADDNASGVAVMLAVASSIRSSSIGLVAFNREEEGMVGSADFVSRWKPRIASAHILEMVGFRSRRPKSQRLPIGLPIKIPDTADFLGILANGNSNDELDLVMKAAGSLPELPVLALKTMLGIEKLMPVLLRSDHVPFWNAKLPALMWTDTSEFRNPHYHQASDRPDTLDYDFMADVARLLAASLLSRDSTIAQTAVPGER